MAAEVAGVEGGRAPSREQPFHPDTSSWPGAAAEAAGAEEVVVVVVVVRILQRQS